MRLVCTLLFLCFPCIHACTAATAPQPIAVDERVSEPHATSSTATNAASSPTPVQELTQQVIGQIVKSHFEELQTCYETTLASDNTLRGIVELELTILQDGSIAEGRLLKDGLGSAELNLCLVKKMVDWKFPAHTDESVTIQFPFAFSPKTVDQRP